MKITKKNWVEVVEGKAERWNANGELSVEHSITIISADFPGEILHS
ncbi:MAG: hypothetical protein JWP81_4110 [Ferruginibacter sp.]|nr:hypothetical protein [Ferruginibacter sp.]